LVFLDADDRYYPERVVDHVRFLGDHPEVVLAGGLVMVHRGRPYVRNSPVVERWHPEFVHKTGVLPERFRLDCCLDYPFHTGAITVRRTAFEQVDGFDRRYHWGEDWDLQVRLAQIGRVGHVPTLACDYLCREGSICATLSPRKYESAAGIYRHWRHKVRGLPASHRRWLRRQEHGSWLLASQVHLETMDDPVRAFCCALQSWRVGFSAWAARSTFRTGLRRFAAGLVRQARPTEPAPGS
jgi:GT2 family glycosyltransferase